MAKKLILPIIIIFMALGFYSYYLVLNKDEGTIYFGEAVGETYKINTTIPGLLEDIYVTEGEMVNIDQIVARIENLDMDYQIELAKTANEIAKAQLTKGTSPVRDEEINILENKIEVLEGSYEILSKSYSSTSLMYEESKINESFAGDTLEKVQLDYSNREKLYENGSLSKSALDSALLLLKSSQSNYDSSVLRRKRLEKDLSILLNERNLISIEIDSVKQQLEMAITGLDVHDKVMAELYYENTETAVDRIIELASKREVRSMQTGIVETMNFEVGEYISPSAPIMTLYDPNMLSVKIYVPETDISYLRIGMDLKVSIASKPDFEPVVGTITKIANQAMFTPSNIVTVKDRERLVFEVELSLSRPDHINPGMLLQVDMSEVVDNE